MLNSNSIGEKIAAARRKATLSQAELARQVSISSQAVGKWERGESMPDIMTLNRIAEILGVDLNYFSERFHSAAAEKPKSEKPDAGLIEGPDSQQERPGWDLSRQNLTDSDFSGLKNLHEKLSSTNIQRCLFAGSGLSNLRLNNNHISDCDFSTSDISSSYIQNSMVSKSKFIRCLLIHTKFSGSFMESCDFTGADFTETEFKSGGFGKNTIANVKLNRSGFVDSAIQDTVFEGILEDCRFKIARFTT